MYTILAVDDAKDTIMLLDFDLASEGYRVITADSGEAALNLLSNNDVHLILLDMYMPGLSGLATLQKIKAQSATSHIPVIMLSASDDEDEIVAALEHGADDYVTKPYIAKVLHARIRTSLRLMEKTQQLEKLARTDFLTGINNRGSFDDLAEKAISQCKRHSQVLAIAMFDIDYFKNINDNHGHEAGDKVLKDFAQLLLQSFREYDIIGRLGGEEFAVCMPNTPMEHAFIACERLRINVQEHITHFTLNEPVSLSVTVSCGVVSASGAELNFNDLLRKADLGLYQAKNSGRNQTVDATELELEENVQDETPKDEIAQTTKEDEKYPGIDFEIGVGNVLGDENLFQEILVMFYQDHHQDRDKIKNALDTENILLAKHLAHTLKGVAASIGAMRLFEKAKELDAVINHQETHLYQQKFDAMALELNKILTGIMLIMPERLDESL